MASYDSLFYMRLVEDFCTKDISNDLPFVSFSFSMQDVLGDADILSKSLSDIGLFSSPCVYIPICGCWCRNL